MFIISYNINIINKIHEYKVLFLRTRISALHIYTYGLTRSGLLAILRNLLSLIHRSSDKTDMATSNIISV